MLDSTRRRRAKFKKSARELRQGGSNYRCCIPALAGFVSPQSIAPDGAKISRKNGIVQSPFAAAGSTALTASFVFACIENVKSIVLLALLILQCSCTTLVTRRDLYSPEPGPNSRERQLQLAATTTTTTTTTTTEREPPLPPPQFR